jgi:hypothetical protein
MNGTNNSQPEVLDVGNNGLPPVPNELPHFKDELNSQNSIKPEISQITELEKEDIGVIPPKKMEKKDNSKFKKGLFIVLIIILIIGVAFGVYYYLSIANSNAKVKPKNIVMELGSTVSTNPSFYADFNGVAPENCVMNTTQINTKQVGTYNYSITCGNKTYNGVVNVKDTIAPKTNLQDVVKVVGESVEAKEFIVSCDDASTCSYEFGDLNAITSDLQTPGEYSVDIIVSDTSGNKSTVKGTLNVLSKKITAYLSCTGEATSLKDYAGYTYTYDTFAIDDTNTYLGIAYRIKRYSFLKTDEYTKVKTDNNGKTEYDGTKGIINFDDTLKYLNIENKLTNDDLTKEYGSEFPNNYNSIKTYYEQKGYVCATKTEK